jgi:hypothetical protein
MVTALDRLLIIFGQWLAKLGTLPMTICISRK